MAWASSPLSTSLIRRSDAASLTRRRMPGARVRSSATSSGTTQRLAVPTMPKSASPDSRPLQHRDVGAHRVDLAPDAPGSVEDHGAALRGHRALPASLEQPGAELVLELAHLLRHVGLDRGEGIGRAGERTLFFDGQAGCRDAANPYATSLVDPSSSAIVSIARTCWTDSAPACRMVSADHFGESVSPLPTP